MKKHTLYATLLATALILPASGALAQTTGSVGGSTTGSLSAGSGSSASIGVNPQAHTITRGGATSLDSNTGVIRSTDPDSNNSGSTTGSIGTGTTGSIGATTTMNPDVEANVNADIESNVGANPGQVGTGANILGGADVSVGGVGLR